MEAMNTPGFYSLPLLLAAVVASAADWPAWRGPNGDGRSSEKGLPVMWSATQNVRWRTPLPEPGNSTPIVSNKRVFVTEAVGDRRTLMCFDRADGRLLWQKGVTARQKDPTHATNPYCSASPVTDGQRVIASFASEGLYCYDFEGRELWHRDDLGRQIHIWGNAASPVIYRDLCFLNFGPGETTYLLAVDKRTGKTRWKRDEDTGYGKPESPDQRLRPGPDQAQSRPTYIGSWSTPTIISVSGAAQLFMSWPRRLAAYEPETGREIWTCGGLNPLVYTSPIHDDGITVVMGGFSGVTLAVGGGRGDVSNSRRRWLQARSPQRIGSGVIHQGHIYVHNDSGAAQCINLRTGETVWQERLHGHGTVGRNWSSVMLCGDNCYTITQGGDCFVFKARPEFTLVSINSLDEPSNSSVAASDGELFIRTQKALWCISQR